MTAQTADPEPPASEWSPLDRVDHWPLAWVASVSVAVLTLAAWQRSPGWTTLAIAAVATTAAGVWTRTLRHPRIWAVGAILLLAMAVSLAIRDTLTLQTASRDWAEWSKVERETRATRVADALTTVARRLTDAADRVAADESLLARLVASGTSAGGLLSPPLDATIESALLVFRGSRLVARTGQTRTIVSPTGPRGIQLIDGSFYSSLVARATTPDGALQVVAVALISAIPPADRFARALTQSSDRASDVARTIVESPDSSRVEEGTTVIVVPDGTRRLARVRALARTEGETRLALLQRARARMAVPLVLAVLLILITGWRRPARTVHRLAMAMVLLLAIAVAPLSALSNVSPLFDASSYYAAMGGPWTANVASLLFTTALGLALLFLALRSGRVVRLTSSRVLASALVLISATLGPFVLRDLARGIALPANGVSVVLWLAWQLAIALAGASILQAGAAAGRTILGNRRGLPPMTAPSLAIVAAVLAPMLWRAPGAWPGWYPVLWGVAIGALALTRRGVALVTGAAVIAGAGAVTLTWGATVRARMNLAQYDLARLSAVDDNAFRLLERFASALSTDRGNVNSSEALLRRYAASELAQAGYPARLARWDTLTPGVPAIDLRLAPVADSIGAQVSIAAMARNSRAIEIRAVEDGPTTMLIAAVPTADGSVTTIAVPPRTRLLPMDPLAALTGIASTPSGEPPYRLTLAAAPSDDVAVRTLQWRRRGDVMHGDGVATGGGESRLVHVEVDLRGLDALLPRGALLVLLDVAVVLLLWGASATADGAFGRWLRVRRARVRRSYRVRLSATLLAFFVAPAALFAGNAWYRLQDDDRAARELLVREALRTAASDVTRRDLAATAASVGSPIFLYHAAQLDASSDTLLQALAPLGRLLPVSLDDSDFGADDIFTTRRIPVGATQALVGFRRVASGPDESVVVTPARGDEFALDARREDLGILLLFTAALGALAAVWSSGIAARTLSRPVGTLREAALAIAAGREAPALGSAPAAEFAPVYRAFERMSEDLSTSRAALEAAQRRTAAVLQHVASGVVAMRTDGAILIANPRAEQLLQAPLRQPYASIAELPLALALLANQCLAFLASDADDEAFDQFVSGRQLRGRLTRLPAGAVLTVDDITELASAQRVLAWGEMARQVAHEIKNPLTPIRLGVQHLRRAYRDGRGDFGTILDSNVTRILAEIDHLDEIARAFSRYGMAPDQREPAIAVDIRAVVHDVMALEQLGDSEVQWTLNEASGPHPIMVYGQYDELKEVVLNLLENARLAQSRRVTVRIEVVADGVAIDVTDDGQGIPSEVLPQVFEPHFSTRTSGSGLGLAISRRLIEGWGGRIAVESTVGVGTVVHVLLRQA
ncbi:MAG: HAMP domain-containing protein [Gemmatimonadaceae bacterium]|nr:HAMP domain-containing protein [Gemmatimonadaceae bacterium]